MRRAGLVFVFVASALLPTAPATAAPGGAWSVVQPAEGGGELLLLSRPGRLRVERPDGAGGVVLRPGEEVTAAAELARGWVAAGRRLDDERRGLFLMTDDAQGVRRLPAPAGGAGALRLRPRLLVREGSLDGMAWLEGDEPRRLGVRVADWSGVDWGPVRRLDATRRGSQTGLTAAALAGGERLLVWSAFDGSDDELVFSLDRGGGWPPPRRLAPPNRVPDVAPTAIGAGEGALAVWNRLDGDRYVLVMARWHDGAWEDPRRLEVEGGLFPELLRLGDRILLLYRAIEPRGWGALELDAEGRILRRARVSRDAADRPALALDGRSGISLRFAPRGIEKAGWSVP